MRPPRNKPLVTALLAVLVLAAACGGDDDPDLATVPDPTPTSADTTDASPAPSPESDAATPTPDDDTTGQDGNADDDSDDDSEDDREDDDTTTAPGGGEAIPTPTQVPTSGEPDFTTSSKLSTIGLDAVFFGDTPDDAAERGDIEWVGLPEPGSAPRCYTIQPSGGPSGIIFTVVDSHIERVDIANATITTISGAGVGSTQAQLFDLFGDQLEETETDDGATIVFVPDDEEDADFRIIWITDGLAATSMRAGRIPVVLTDSPCG